jgi:hypothetical protein
MKPKLSAKSRAALVATFNQQIANAPTADSRRQLANVFESTLMSLGCYRGFGYNEWDTGGYSRWVADGRPSDNTPYLGDKSLVTLY